MRPDVLILGCGFTGSRVAQRLRGRGYRVIGIRSGDIDLTQSYAAEKLKSFLSPGCLLLHSVPSLPGAEDRKVVSSFGDHPRRVVYFSTTGVYGARECVDADTPIWPLTLREIARADTEAAVARGPWESLILRPAAIYGPGRGVHVTIAQGRYWLLGEGSNFISRIHVDDLAAITEAALLSELTGAYPVADRYPCSSREIAEFCAGLLGLPVPVTGDVEEIPPSRRANRRVDGSAICQQLGIELKYPSYREGIPACIEAESATMGKAR